MSFCPFIKDRCLEEKCKLWLKDGGWGCSIVVIARAVNQGSRLSEYIVKKAYEWIREEEYSRGW